MFSNEKKINNLFLYWLNTSLILIFFIIIIGGLTRLTNSGLSITKWELFDGILPPLNKDSWKYYFDEYKTIPQFILLNSSMTLNEFKVIFYWEYFHRVLARFIGIFFVLPLIFFQISKKINSKHLKICYIIFSLIVFQGIIGWFMVKSGLVNNITVSHYRLSVHLITAILIISIIFWLIKNIKSNQEKNFFKFSRFNLPFLTFIFLIFIQIIMGAFVSGLDAGKIYQTWPMMGSNYFPNDFLFTNLKDVLEFNNHSLVQFYHRNLAYLILIYALFLSLYIYRNKIFHLYGSMKIVLFFLFLQSCLGILTLLTDLNIFIASSHQITSVLLVFSALNLYYLRVK